MCNTKEKIELETFNCVSFMLITKSPFVDVRKSNKTTANIEANMAYPRLLVFDTTYTLLLGNLQFSKVLRTVKK